MFVTSTTELVRFSYYNLSWTCVGLKTVFDIKFATWLLSAWCYQEFSSMSSLDDSPYPTHRKLSGKNINIICFGWGFYVWNSVCSYSQVCDWWEVGLTSLSLNPYKYLADDKRTTPSEYFELAPLVNSLMSLMVRQKTMVNVNRVC